MAQLTELVYYQHIEIPCNIVDVAGLRCHFILAEGFIRPSTITSLYCMRAVNANAKYPREAAASLARREYVARLVANRTKLSGRRARIAAYLKAAEDELNSTLFQHIRAAGAGVNAFVVCGPTQNIAISAAYNAASVFQVPVGFSVA